ncbi:MAG: response regulator [Thermodesulfobacteriota bacterium]
MGARILVVDDEKEFALALSERLALRGYQVNSCFSGGDAVEAVRGEEYDVVILDVAMPGMDGIETMREIKKWQPLLEVILLSGRATVETAIEGLRRGAFDYMKKPCETDELLMKINDAHARKAGHEEKIRQARVREGLPSS